MGMAYWAMNIMGGDAHGAQLFLNDPSGNMLEVHQLGRCRCMPLERGGKGRKA
jgi:hypothetical protein